MAHDQSIYYKERRVQAIPDFQLLLLSIRIRAELEIT